MVVQVIKGAKKQEQPGKMAGNHDATRSDVVSCILMGVGYTHVWPSWNARIGYTLGCLLFLPSQSHSTIIVGLPH